MLTRTLDCSHPAISVSSRSVIIAATSVLGTGLAVHSTSRTTQRKIFNAAIRHAIPLSFAIQLGLIAFGEYQDRYSDVKYTDIDYRVFSDAVRCLWTGCGQGERGVASGFANRWVGGAVGE